MKIHYSAVNTMADIDPGDAPDEVHVDIDPDDVPDEIIPPRTYDECLENDDAAALLRRLEQGFDIIPYTFTDSYRRHAVKCMAALAPIVQRHHAIFYNDLLREVCRDGDDDKLLRLIDAGALGTRVLCHANLETARRVLTHGYQPDARSVDYVLAHGDMAVFDEIMTRRPDVFNFAYFLRHNVCSLKRFRHIHIRYPILGDVSDGWSVADVARGFLDGAPVPRVYPPLYAVFCAEYLARRRRLAEAVLAVAVAVA